MGVIRSSGGGDYLKDPGTSWENLTLLHSSFIDSVDIHPTWTML